MSDLTRINRNDRARKKAQANNPSHRLRTFSFLTTTIVILLLIAGSYFGSLPKVEHIPDNFQFNRQTWMEWVPSRTQYVAYVSYEQAYAVSSNPQLFGSQPILQLYQLNFALNPESVLYEVDIQLPPSVQNLASVTVSVIKIRGDVLSVLSAEVAKAKVAKSQYDGYTIANLLIVNPTDQKLLTGYLSIAGESVVVSSDPGSGKVGVEAILDQYTSKAPSLFDAVSVRRGVYSSGVTDQPYVGLFVGAFPSQLNNTRMIVKSVLQDSNGVLVTRSLAFSGQDQALGQYGEAQRVYRNADTYRMLDEWLVISYHYSIDKLRGELTGI